MHTSRNSIQ